MGLKRDHISAGICDSVDKGVGRTQAAVVGLCHLADYLDALAAEIEGDHDTNWFDRTAAVTASGRVSRQKQAYYMLSEF